MNVDVDTATCKRKSWNVFKIDVGNNKSIISVTTIMQYDKSINRGLRTTGLINEIIE